jgi:hypothetical protein
MSTFEFDPSPKQRLPHSIYGILSFFLALFSAVTFCALIGFITYQVATNPEIFKPENFGQPPTILEPAATEQQDAGNSEEHPIDDGVEDELAEIPVEHSSIEEWRSRPELPVLPVSFVIVGVGIWGCVFMTFAALILGIVGLCQPHTRKVFSILGLLLSVPPILFLAVSMIIGVIAMMSGMPPGGRCC